MDAGTGYMAEITPLVFQNNPASVFTGDLNYGPGIYDKVVPINLWFEGLRSKAGLGLNILAIIIHALLFSLTLMNPCPTM